MLILTAIILSFLLTIFFGLKNNYAKRNPQKYVQRCLVAGSILVPIVGKTEGTFYSHGFDIHWLYFGLLNLFVIFATAVIVIGLVRLRGAIKGGSGDDGLIPRFQLAVWPDSNTPWQNVDRVRAGEGRAGPGHQQ